MVASNQPLAGRPSPESIAEKAERIYCDRLRDVLEPEHVGEFVVINVDTGEYELDPDDTEASERAAAKHPAKSLFAMRVGYRSLGTIGYGKSTRR